MYVSVIVWTLREGKTHDDFVRAWYPDESSGKPTTAYTAVNITNEHEVIAVGIHETDMSRDELAQTLLRASAKETTRNRRLAEVVESARPGRFFEVTGTFDLSSDQALEAGRP